MHLDFCPCVFKVSTQNTYLYVNGRMLVFEGCKKHVDWTFYNLLLSENLFVMLNEKQKLIFMDVIFLFSFPFGMKIF